MQQERTMEKQRFRSKQKANDLAIWKSFCSRKQGREYHVAGNEISGYYLVSVLNGNLKRHTHVDMDFAHIRSIHSDLEPLKHWEEIRGLFSSVDGELLRFILTHHIPLEKFIRYELASRGFDEDHYWVGFEKARSIWLGEAE